ncbi:MAG: glycogen synthase [Fusobacteriaceae bacterium]
MKILYAASEAFPFIKVGESGDVAAALPKYINRTGEAEVRVILPNFSQIDPLFRKNFKTLGQGKLMMGGKEIQFAVEHLKYLETDYYFISSDIYFDRERIYGESDDPERFAFFSRAVIQSLDIIGFHPDIIHCNNIATALIPVFLREKKDGKNRLSRIKTLFTIHSLKHHGIANRDILQDVLDLNPEEYFLEESMKFYDSISFLKGAVVYADGVNTVSATYLDEILTEDGGMGLSGLFEFYRKKISGIKNGIDTEVFDPKKDNEIEFNYGYTTLDRRRENKLQLQKELGLHENTEIPLVAVIGKLEEEKGMELLKEKMDALLSEKIEMVILGSGLEKYEDFFDYYAHLYPDKIYTQEFRNDFLTKKILSGADIILTPSLSEPCGLIQMLALRYGAIPVARVTGGIGETLNSENSFLFHDYSGDAMLHAVQNALHTYQEDRAGWLKKIEKGMRARNSWGTPAKKYLALYKKLTKK